MNSKLTVSREIAYDAFIQVMDHKKDPDEVIEKICAKQSKAIKRVDRNMIKEMVFGGLRWYSKIFWIVQKTSKRDLQKASPEIQSALVLGTYQIFYMDKVPDRAAVNESVEYIRKKGQAHAVKFVNGILRSIARRAEYFTKPDKEKKPVEYLSLQYAHPKWMVERWFSRFSFDRLKELLSCNNRTPPYSIRINSLKVPLDSIQELREKLLREEKNQSVKKSLRSCLNLKNAPSFEKESLFQQGYYTVQDEASQLIGYLVNPQQGELIVDACCGPGGKISHVYELGKGEATVIGVEKNKDQLEKAKQNCQRLGIEDIDWQHLDFLNFKSRKKMNKILLDAPCSGLGVIRRHPEGKWHKQPAIIPQMEKVQRELITHAFSLLKKGGELIYSVCSFEPEESLYHLDWLQKEFKDKIEVVNIYDRIPDYYGKFVTREGALIIYSGNKDLMDGFGSFVIKKID